MERDLDIESILCAGTGVKQIDASSKIVLVDGEIRSGTGAGVIQALLEIQADDPLTEITMLINSPGGDANELMGIIDAMEIVNNDIRTVVIGKAMSAGAIIALCGTKGKRSMTRNSVMMLHSISAGTFGNIKDINIEVEEIKRLNDVVIELISKRSNLSTEEVKKLIDRDRYIMPEEAIEFGLVDDICTSLK